MKRSLLPMAWIILAVAFMTQMASAGGHFSFGVFLKPLVEEFGWSRGATSFAYSLLFWVASPSAILLGWLSDRLGSRRVLLLGGVIFSLGIFLSGYVHNIWQYYFFFGVLGGLGRASARAPLLSAVFRYFTKRKGLAAGITLSGTGAGTFIFPALARYVISAFDWRMGFFAIGLTVLLILVPAALVIRNPRPGETESERNGNDPTMDEESQDGILGVPNQEWTMSQLMKNRGLWTLLVTGFACCASHSLPLAHIVAYASDRGIPDIQAAGVLGVLGMVAVVGRILCGLASDRIGGRKTVLICLIVQTSMLFLVAFARSPWAFYLFALVFGLAYGGVTPQYSVVTRELFGMRRFGTTYGMHSFATSAGMGAGGLIGGYLFDLTGSYFPAFITSTVLGSIAVIGATRLILLKGSGAPLTEPSEPVLATSAGAAS